MTTGVSTIMTTGVDTWRLLSQGCVTKFFQTLAGTSRGVTEFLDSQLAEMKSRIIEESAIGEAVEDIAKTDSPPAHNAPSGQSATDLKES